MDRHFAKALLFAWNKPAFREGLQHLIDLDEVTSLLATLAGDSPHGEAQQRGLQLLRSALESDEIRRAVLLLIDDASIREAIGQGLLAEMADRPGLAGAVRSALDDPAVRREIHAALESPRVRSIIWAAADSQLRDRKWTLARYLIGLMRHRSFRRLVRGVARHGVLREAWRDWRRSDSARRH
ncbi:hypothetical protein Rhe02_00240 [Rhizocola hellebori]|uniref:Uncharacterized protein n=1 Tax=Rhizocola hellebori TaxID=1392758 RepID=A0A8J3Q201_9ACTN|nr:hypothetical protein [Rhizocola hellebori]GIH01957.1 hypothetical protein Rhe02_00240 [Rhizocola hellebori]